MVLFRLATADDAPEMLDIYRPLIENSAVSFEFVPPVPQEFADRIKKVQERFPWLICLWDDTVAGYAYGGPHRSREAYQWSVEWSVYVHDGFRRRGIAKGLYQSLEAILELQGFHNALAGITLPNPGSVAFHQSYGFTPIGIYRDVGFKLGSWRSVGWWQKRIGPCHPQPKTPLTLSEATKLPEFAHCLNQGLKCLKS